MSSARHAVHLADNFTGFGKRPDLTPSHQLVLPRGITLSTCGNRKKPVSGISCMSRSSSLHSSYYIMACPKKSRRIALSASIRVYCITPKCARRANKDKAGRAAPHASWREIMRLARAWTGLHRKPSSRQPHEIERKWSPWPRCPVWLGTNQPKKSCPEGIRERRGCGIWVAYRWHWEWQNPSKL